MPTTFVKGDLFEDTKGPDLHALAFAADCGGSMERGVAVAFKKRWAAFAEAFIAHTRVAKKMQLGDLFAWRADDEKIAVYALGVFQGTSDAKLASLITALDKMLEQAKADGISRVALPRIGATGLDPVRVKRVLTDAGDKTPITIVVFDQFVRARGAAGVDAAETEAEAAEKETPES